MAPQLPDSANIGFAFSSTIFANQIGFLLLMLTAYSFTLAPSTFFEEAHNRAAKCLFLTIDVLQASRSNAVVSHCLVSDFK